jgi:hypothetical protein
MRGSPYTDVTRSARWQERVVAIDTRQRCAYFAAYGDLTYPLRIRRAGNKKRQTLGPSY